MSVIKIENLGKRYIINHESQPHYSTLRDKLSNSSQRIITRLRHPLKHIRQDDEIEHFWALKDINFEIQQGDRVGIIGRNGAGKSTLLKILSRITAPTTGKVTINGRVASLLEVGTGFHPELTGRENIFLNGAILGMRKNEIQKKFDEIVNFSEVEKFLDTPVKHYSSGMYVRLAFAVAAHLEPEILIVDEVLAVGDAQFQKKCIHKMDDAGYQGRTIIFVSHNLAAVKLFCNRGILLNKGKLLFDGGVNESTEIYYEKFMTKWTSDYHNKTKPHIICIELKNQNNDSTDIFEGNDACYLTLRVDTYNIRNIIFGFTIFNSDNIGIFSGVTTDNIENIEFKICDLQIQIPINLLNPGYYRLEGCFCDTTTVYEQSECFLSFMYLKNNSFDLKGNKSKGIFRLPGNWKVLEAKE